MAKVSDHIYWRELKGLRMALSVGNIAFGLQEFAKNFAMGFAPFRFIRLKSNRIRTSAAPDKSLLGRYAYWLPELILKYIGSVEGKDILEIGPGDHIGTGLAFIALGARSYTTLDRFTRNYSNQLARGWYALVQEEFSATFSRPWPGGLSHDSFPQSCDKVKCLRMSIEELGDCSQYDIVCSYAVAEHVSSVPRFAEANRRLLRRDGRALHAIDFSGHGWERNGDEMLFTRIPEWAWSAMGSNRGYPNRIPFPDFKLILESAGLDVQAVNQKPFKTNDNIQEATFLLARNEVGGDTQLERMSPVTLSSQLLEKVTQ